MVERTQREGEFWADKLMDLGNLSSVVLVFGQLAMPRTPWDGVIAGIAFYVVCVIIARFIRKRG